MVFSRGYDLADNKHLSYQPASQQICVGSSGTTGMGKKRVLRREGKDPYTQAWKKLKEREKALLGWCHNAFPRRPKQLMG